MIIKTISFEQLIPDEGKKLTNGGVIAEYEVNLCDGDSPDNWYEITEAEAEKIQEERNVENELIPDNR